MARKKALALNSRVLRTLSDRAGVRVAIALMAGLVTLGDLESARAFDFFGLWGSADKPPPVSRSAISYSVKIDVVGGAGGLVNSVRDASSLYKLRNDAPPDGEALARRATNDFGPIIDGLWGAGYYNASATITLGAASLTIKSSEIGAFARVAESYRNRAVAPAGDHGRSGTDVQAPLDPRRRCGWRRVSAGTTSGSDRRPQAGRSGGCGRSSRLAGADHRLFPQSGPTVRQSSFDRAGRGPYRADDGRDPDRRPRTAGRVRRSRTLVGPKSFDPAIARSFLYIQPGDLYSPRALADARTTLRQIPAVGGVRITEGTALNAYGQLPYQIDVEDRLPYAVGASAKYSTTNGPAAQVYFEDRNVFGGAEDFRLQADVFSAPPWYESSTSVRDFSIHDLGGRLSASFMKPALWGTRNDLLVDARWERMSTSGAGFIGYEAQDEDATVALRHRFSQTFYVQAGVEGQTGVTRDALGKVDYTLIGVPLSVNYDTTDDKLNPTRGVRVNASVSAFPTFLGSSLDLFQGKARASTYYALDGDGRFVLAGRVGLGALGGAALDDIPANWRFYAGGGGSVRGYAFNSLGPTVFWGPVIGGRSLFESSAELRIRVTDTIGVVPFFDAGNAFESSLPNFSAPLYSSVGIGLRYFTAIGQIRADLAFPLERREGNRPVALYVSIGQSF